MKKHISIEQKNWIVQDFTLLCFSVFSNLVLTGSVDEELGLVSNTEAFIFSFTLGAVTRLV